MRRNLLVVSILVMVMAVLFTACTPDLSLEVEAEEIAEPQVVEEESASAEEAEEAVEADEPETDAPDEETQSALSGQIQIAGSTTVQPLSEKLALAFMESNPDLVIEVQGGGSSVGVTAASISARHPVRSRVPNLKPSRIYRCTRLPLMELLS